MNNHDFNHLPLTGWYPGHMLKAGRRMREVLKLVDLVVELVDSRAPASSRNPAFRELLHGKPVLVVANKADLADPDASREWEAWFRAEGESVCFLDSRHVSDTRKLVDVWRREVERERWNRGAKKALNRPVRIMIAGIPNVGKSTLVNRLHSGRKAEVGPKPGVTRETQWIPLEGDVELLDTPGVLWPRIRDKEHELKLGLIGSVRDEVLGVELLAEFLWSMLARQPAHVDWGLYDLDSCPEEPHWFMEAVARRRGLLRGGGAIDYDRTATALLKDFRDCRLGRLTLDHPPGDSATHTPESREPETQSDSL